MVSIDAEETEMEFPLAMSHFRESGNLVFYPW